MKLAAVICIAFGLIGAQPVTASELTDEQILVTYALEIVGLPVGWSAVEFTFDETGEYRVDFGLKFEFLFWHGGAAGASTGKVEAGEVKPTVCDVTVIQDGSVPVGMWEIFGDNKVTHWSISPDLDEKYSQSCVPLAEADIEAALDPLSALIVLAETAEEACDRTLAVFVFGTRFDLMLTPGQHLEAGIYACDVSYQPISGHRETSESVGVLMRSRPKLTIFQVAPGLWVPHTAKIPTRVGSLVFERLMP